MDRDTSSSPPTFEEWRHLCLTLSTLDDKPQDEETVLREHRIFQVRPRLLAANIVRLFEHASDLLTQATPDQVARLTHVIFGIETEFFKKIREDKVPKELQIHCYTAVPTLYVDLYDKLCDRGNDDLDSAVFMIWDMDCIEGPLMFPRLGPHLVDPGFNVLDSILKRCSTPSCLTSALHGLGHLQRYDNQRVEQIISSFLDERGSMLSESVLRYADQARMGGVM